MPSAKQKESPAAVAGPGRRPWGRRSGPAIGPLRPVMGRGPRGVGIGAEGHPVPPLHPAPSWQGGRGRSGQAGSARSSWHRALRGGFWGCQARVQCHRLTRMAWEFLLIQGSSAGVGGSVLCFLRSHFSRNTDKPLLGAMSPRGGFVAGASSSPGTGAVVWDADDWHLITTPTSVAVGSCFRFLIY